MLISVCLLLFGILLFVVGLLLYRKNKGDMQSAKIYSLTYYLGFALWFSRSLYLLYKYILRSFGLIDYLIIFFCFAVASMVILAPAWGKNKQKQKLRILASGLIILILLYIKFVFLFGSKPTFLSDISVDNTGFQTAYDNSYAIKQFAETSFQTKMDGQEYNIISTAYGFVVSDEFYYIVSFKYECGGHEKVYGYKVLTNEHGTYKIMDESEDIGLFAMHS